MEILELAQPSDWEAINELCRQVQKLHIRWRPDIFREAECLYPMEYLLEDIREKLVYTAKNNGKIVGYVLLRTWSTNGPGSVPCKVLDIDDITVDECCRHQGIGQKIMADVKRLAKELDCRDIQLSVYPQNESAIRFYEKCGFQVRNVRYQLYI